MIYFRRILNFSTYLLIFLSYFNLSFSSCEITVFDCGQGNAVAARFNGQSMVFDAGRTAYASFVKYDDDRSGDSEINKEYIIIENSPHPLRTAYVEPEKFTLAGGPVPGNTAAYKETFKTSFKEFVGTSLKAVFISHPDFDHYKLIKELSLQPDIYILGGSYNLYSKAFKDYINDKNILGTAHDYANLKTATSYTNHLKFTTYCKFTGSGSAPTVDILSINASGSGKLKDKNADSMIVRVSHNNRSILITGDAEEETWASVPAVKREFLKSDILIIPHHGSLTNGSTTEDILKEIQPKVCFISAGFQYSHPSSEVINLLLDYYRENQYRTTPHYVTFFENNVRKAIITNAPIFTTIDNGALFVNLLSGPLNVKVSRDFSPAPNKTLEDEEGNRLLMLMDNSYEFIDFKSLKYLDKDRKPLNDTPFGKKIYRITDSSNKEHYYYRFGSAYLKMKLFQENDEEDKFELWNSSIEEWRKSRSSEIYVHKINFLGVTYQ